MQADKIKVLQFQSAAVLTELMLIYDNGNEKYTYQTVV